MTHVITQACCNDAGCVAACPVNCIHPTPDEPDYLDAEMLYVDPDACIDCGACADVCPVGAVTADFELEPGDEPFLELNRRWYADPRHRAAAASARPAAPEPSDGEASGPLTVAVVGTGPAAQYLVEELATTRGLQAEITVFERLMTPGGLVRFGVAPDHRGPKKMADRLGRALRRPGVTVRLGVEVGSDIGIEDLLAAHHAVVMAVGAAGERSLGIPGEQLPGSHTAGELVGWYNGHPDRFGQTFDLSARRAVVVGNGNVALDVARVLLSAPASLTRTDVPANVLEALEAGNIREVLVLGRRGPDAAAFSAGELLGLERHSALTVTAQRLEPSSDTLGEPAGFKVERLRALPGTAPQQGRHLGLRFWSAPVRILGEDRVEAIRVADPRTGETEDVPCGLVVRAIGYRGRPVPGLPFDEERGVVPNDAGRVLDTATGRRVAGAYVAGWIKRGAKGGIGANKMCAKETAAGIVADFLAGRLPTPQTPGTGSGPGLGLKAWEAIDAHERAAGRAAGRPRVKIADPEELRRVALERGHRP
ncbi:FAD-dependent oxidoreductase [Streptomyces sp. NPDC007264]|uniref:FAD-dependent oxidoreductase n=1 Tax=Streptomyces sp. NPDC007264 TaxID=3364777 RepID=UPI0036DCE866